MEMFDTNCPGKLGGRGGCLQPGREDLQVSLRPVDNACDVWTLNASNSLHSRIKNRILTSLQGDRMMFIPEIPETK